MILTFEVSETETIEVAVCDGSPDEIIDREGISEADAWIWLKENAKLVREAIDERLEQDKLERFLELDPPNRY